MKNPQVTTNKEKKINTIFLNIPSVKPHRNLVNFCFREVFELFNYFGRKIEIK